MSWGGGEGGNLTSPAQGEMCFAKLVETTGCSYKTQWLALCLTRRQPAFSLFEGLFVLELSFVRVDDTGVTLQALASDTNSNL